MPDLSEIMAMGKLAAEQFVEDSIAMDKAWKAGSYSEWLKSYADRVIGEFRDGGTTDSAAEAPVAGQGG